MCNKYEEYYDGIPQEIRDMTPEEIDKEIKRLEQEEKNKWVIDDNISEEDLTVKLTDEEIAEIEKRHKEFGIED